MNLTETNSHNVGIIGKHRRRNADLLETKQIRSTSDALSKAFDALEKVTNLVGRPTGKTQ